MDEFTKRYSGARAVLEEAGVKLIALDPTYGKDGELFVLDKELYSGLFDASLEVRKAIIEVFRARVDDYRAIAHGFAKPHGPTDRASADIHEWYAQVVEAVLENVGDGHTVPERLSFDEFMPDWYPDTSGRRRPSSG